MEAEQHAAEQTTDHRRNKNRNKNMQKKRMKMKTQQPKTYGTL